MSFEQVAVILLNYKSWEDTLREARMVHDLFQLRWHQIIIVDNASPNESEEKLKEKAIGDYIFIETGSNRGYAAGNNVGLRYAKEHGYQYGWVINNDIIMDDDTLLGKMVEIMESDPAVAVVNPDVMSPDGFVYNRDSVRPAFYDLTIGMIAYRKKGREIHNLGGYGYIYRPQGCCMLLDLSKLEKVNYLDETVFLYCEEPILAEKLLKKQWRCAVAADKQIIHNRSRTVKASIGKWKRISIQNRSFGYYLTRYRQYGRVKKRICILFNTVKNLIAI